MPPPPPPNTVRSAVRVSIARWLKFWPKRTKWTVKKKVYWKNIKLNFTKSEEKGRKKVLKRSSVFNSCVLAGNSFGTWQHCPGTSAPTPPPPIHLQLSEPGRTHKKDDFKKDAILTHFHNILLQILKRIPNKKILKNIKNFFISLSITSAPTCIPEPKSTHPTKQPRQLDC